ncbi:MAG: hypothetical protein OEV92_10585 [Nitrospinota bacterium]|nr:hypothetical protein [Nitrospinota bacterium]
MSSRNYGAAILALCLFASFSCVMPEPLPTRTGKPEVTIKANGVTKKKIVDQAAYYMISQGFKIDRVDDYAAVFIKHGTTYRYENNQSIQEPQDERITLNLLDSAEGINVIGTVETLNYTQGRGPIVDDNSQYGERAQWLFNMLWQVSSDLSSGKKGISGK